MYDRATSIRKIGFEVQYGLLIDPRYLVFDAAAKKLGHELDLVRCNLEHALPPGWTWVADPTPPRHYLPDDEPLPEAAQHLFMTDHHTAWAHSVGYATYPTYRENDRVGFQLELVSAPLSTSWEPGDLLGPLREAYDPCLVELLERGIVAPYPRSENKQQQINEQINIELHDDAVDRVAALTRMSWLGAGMYWITRLSERVKPRKSHWAAFVDAAFTQPMQEQGRRRVSSDLLSSYALVLDGYLLGTAPTRLTWRWLRKLTTSPAHVALLAQAFDNDYCLFYVHGMPELSQEQMRQVSRRDLELLRAMGIDTVLLDVVLGEPQPHLSRHVHDSLRLDFLRSSVGALYDIDRLADFLRRALDRAGPADPADRIAFPLFHPRKNWNPGCVYLELRAIERVKLAGIDHYPYEFRTLNVGDHTLKVTFVNHLERLSADLVGVFELAMVLGRAFVKELNEGSRDVRARDVDALDRRYGGMLQHLLQYHSPPAWDLPRQTRQSSG